MSANNLKIEALRWEIENLNNSINSILREQQNYYLSILKRGYDVRRTGLSWVIVRLVELKIELIDSNFPNFLENSHIDYLLSYSFKEVECNQYKLILKAMKERQIEVNSEAHKVFLNNSNQKKFFLSKFKKNLINDNVTHIKEKDSRYLAETIHLYKNQNLLLDVFSNQENKKVLMFASDEGVFEVEIQNNTSLEKYFKSNFIGKEYFKDILKIRETINSIEEELKNMKQRELAKFKAKFQFVNYEILSNKNVEFDLVYAALFGYW